MYISSFITVINHTYYIVFSISSYVKCIFHPFHIFFFLFLNINEFIFTKSCDNFQCMYGIFSDFMGLIVG